MLIRKEGTFGNEHRAARHSEPFFAGRRNLDKDVSKGNCGAYSCVQVKVKTRLGNVPFTMPLSH
jgi:hypothetical protein